MDKIKIIVIEDDAVIALDIQKHLHKMGYDVTLLETREEVIIAAIEKIKPNLILMNINSHGKMDHIKITETITNHFHIPIVFITAHSDIETFNRVKPSSPYGYLIKPFEHDALRITVELALFKHQKEQADIAEINRRQHEFLANMSHELRTPLTGIIGFAELIQNGTIGLLSPDQKEYMKDVLEGAYHILDIIDDILDLEKFEYSKIHFRPQSINLSQLIYSVIDTLRVITANKEIKFDVKIDPTLTDIVIDPRRLKQMLYNLISNAIKYSPEGGKIEINARHENEGLFRVEINDNGIGIKPENINNLFIMFQQLESSISKKYPGAGLGLALTRRIAEAQGGFVGVESTFGKGSKFYIVLPCLPHKNSFETSEHHVSV